ncbi:MAG: hypothetical protein C0625_02165 [Arcobacter sp.]|nr:MAG: hypothetical protein C0625_02165 [Arcobacter sp.]
MIVVVTQKQRLDELIFSHYGDLVHFTDVLEANNITEVHLEVGQKIELPEYEDDTESIETGGLW